MAADPGRRLAAPPPPDESDGNRTGDMPTAIDLDRLETMLERQVEEVAYESTLRTTTEVLPASLRDFLA